MKLTANSSTSALAPSSLLLLPIALQASVTSASNSRRGVSILSDLHLPDWSLLAESEISWYWNWSPYPGNSTLVTNFEFIPQIHDITNLDANLAQAKSLPDNSTRLMTFNEPDGTVASGGTGISASDAAKAYINDILPLRKANGGRFLISHPATTGSSQGLSWLQDFNTSCYKLAPKTGCPLDFITAHWYGDFAGLSNWITQLDDFYNNNNNGTNSSSPALKIWVSELALPKSDATATLQMMNQSLTYLDGLESVGGYSWFGMFRSDDSNEWTGGNVALFDKNGGLTELGAEYLNSEGNATFKKGQRGVGGAGSLAVGRVLSLVVCLGCMWMMLL